MKGLAAHLISEYCKIEKEMMEEYDARHAILSHLELLALQLAGVENETIIHLTESGQVEMLKERLSQVSLDKAKELLELQQQSGIGTISFQDTMSYPEKLNDLGKKKPVFLHYHGDTDLLYHQAVAVIGSRNASWQGALTARDMGIIYGGTEKDREKWYAQTGSARFEFPNLGDAPYTIVSGLAIGCDAAAHKGCLSVKGETIAVVASGLDITYPVQNKTLQESIIENGGLIVSEQVAGTKAHGNLRARNRIIAALASIVIVAECKENSGTMDAVNHAWKLQRSLFAIDYGFNTEQNCGNRLLLEKGIARSIPYLF